MTLTDPPRKMTPLAARRAWTEPAVRPWWLLAAGVIVAVAVYAAVHLAERRAENGLIEQGVAVNAKVVRTVYHRVAGQTALTGDTVDVSFDWHGQPRTANGVLTRDTAVGAIIPIHVDPADPARWTDQTDATPMAQSVFVGLAVLGIVPVLLAAAWWKRREAARAYRLGVAEVAVVTDRRQTPIAPLSYAVRCRLGGDRRVRTVFVPASGKSLRKGDELAVLVPPGGGRIVAAMWFEEGLNTGIRRHGGETDEDVKRET